MPVSIKGSGGGSVTLDAGAAAADTTLTLPNTSGTLLQSGTTVTVAQGGTGVATLTANAVLIGNGTSAVTAVAPSTAGNVLKSDGTNWTSGTVPSPAALSTASGSAPSYSARAWVNFNGQGVVAIRDSGNVTSITDNGTGDYTVNFTTAMSDANYSVVVTGTVTLGSFYGIGAINGNTAPAAGSVRVFSINNVGGAAASDPAYFCVTILR